VRGFTLFKEKAQKNKDLVRLSCGGDNGISTPSYVGRGGTSIRCMKFQSLTPFSDIRAERGVKD
jgi:hypothetical protein